MSANNKQVEFKKFKDTTLVTIIALMNNNNTMDRVELYNFKKNYGLKIADIGNKKGKR